MEGTLFISADEVAEDFGICKAKAYQIVRDLNKELKERGFITIAGKVSRQYYRERVYGIEEAEKNAGM